MAEPPSLAGPLALSAHAASVHQGLPATVAHGGKAPLPRVLYLGVAEETRCGVPFDAAQDERDGDGAELAADHDLSVRHGNARRYERVALCSVGADLSGPWFTKSTEFFWVARKGVECFE